MVTISICNRETGNKVCDLRASSFINCKNLFKEKFGFVRYYFKYINVKKEVVRVDDTPAYTAENQVNV